MAKESFQNKFKSRLDRTVLANQHWASSCIRNWRRFTWRSINVEYFNCCSHRFDWTDFVCDHELCFAPIRHGRICQRSFIFYNVKIRNFQKKVSIEGFWIDDAGWILQIAWISYKFWKDNEFKIKSDYSFILLHIFLPIIVVYEFYDVIYIRILNILKTQNWTVKLKQFIDYCKNHFWLRIIQYQLRIDFPPKLVRSKSFLRFSYSISQLASQIFYNLSIISQFWIVGNELNLQITQTTNDHRLITQIDRSMISPSSIKSPDSGPLISLKFRNIVQIKSVIPTNDKGGIRCRCYRITGNFPKNIELSFKNTIFLYIMSHDSWLMSINMLLT